MKRRDLFSGLLATAAAGSTTLTPSPAHAQLPQEDAVADYRISNGRLRQSIMGWTYNERMDMLDLAAFCKEIGMSGMEGISADLYPQIREMGLEISLVSGGHGLSKGPCNPEFHDLVVDNLREAILLAAEIGTRNVITFTGMRYPGMNDADAARDCVKAWKEVLPLAEDKGVTLVLEHLNSRDDTHPMKGHPGYFGDDVDFCVDLISDTNSPNMQLLFDIYHVSIMNGDVIRRIRQYHDVIGHYHTAGNPGRGELDDTQEINFPPIIREILATGYTGWLTQEFIPTWDDHLLALRHAVMTCDV